MEGKFFETDVIESYLTGKMSGGDKQLFESAMAQDPLLRNEVAFQKDVIYSLKEFRKAELKARLNNIDAGTATGGTSLGKIAAGISILAFLGAGAFYFISGEKTSGNNAGTPAIPQVSDISEPSGKITEAAPAEDLIKETETRGSAEKDVSVKPPSIKPAEDKVARIKEQESEQSDITVHLPDVSPFSNEAADINGSVNVPKGDLTTGTSVSSAKPEVEYQRNRKDFHYRYYNHKLYLYGDFDSEVVEFLELNSAKRKSLYLHYDSGFYLLNPNQIEKAPLEKISDAEIVRQLETLKKK